MTASPTCPCCGQPMRTFDQPALHVSGAPIVMADCWTPGCALYAVTLTAGEHDLLTPAEIAAYGASMPVEVES